MKPNQKLLIVYSISGTVLCFSLFQSLKQLYRADIVIFNWNKKPEAWREEIIYNIIVKKCLQL